MNKVIFILTSTLLLFGCASSDENKNKEANQKPQFGQPESVIPWNQPADWEKNGQLGSMPGLNQSH
jgi:outer membrane biogenesis lipoprotein LolB